ncbi:hypothetical protein CTA1_12466 [Colletotrichum tanaceti]|uniref:Uncharacterized protein n=1 Tax=Colletotrichum tanaceti TaxID=1306861 RepID=A0A4U6X1R6_9PEZI|nr:hypothetical protein CTA1_12466 [Colletotrichum tanaceti]
MPLDHTSRIVPHHYLVRPDDLAEFQFGLDLEHALVAPVVRQLVPFPPDRALLRRRRSHRHRVTSSDTAAAVTEPGPVGMGAGGAVVLASRARDIANEDAENGDGGRHDGDARLAGPPDDEVAAIVWKGTSAGLTTRPSGR